MHQEPGPSPLHSEKSCGKLYTRNSKIWCGDTFGVTPSSIQTKRVRLSAMWNSRVKISSTVCILHANPMRLWLDAKQNGFKPRSKNQDLSDSYFVGSVVFVLLYFCRLRVSVSRIFVTVCSPSLYILFLSRYPYVLYTASPIFSGKQTECSYDPGFEI